MLPVLRQYQLHGASAIRQAFAVSRDPVLFVGVTSYGKTMLFASLCERGYVKGTSMWVLVNQTKLHTDTRAKFRDEWNIPHGGISPGQVYDGQRIQVVMIPTLANRLKKGWRPEKPPAVLIFDEADLIKSESWQAAIKAFPDALVLGFTGTPIEGDGDGLGHTFKRMILGPTPRWMMDNNFIARPRYMPFAFGEQVKLRGDESDAEIAEELALQKPSIVGDTVAHYLNKGEGLTFLGAAIDITNAEKMTEAWKKEGIRCEALHSDIRLHLQDAIFRDLHSGAIQGVWNVEKIGRGVDVPRIKYLCDAAPCHTLRKIIQRWGRVIRWWDGKRPIIADHVGNLWRHGTVEMDRKWSLDGVPKSVRERELLEAVSQCPHCFLMFPKAPICPECGHELTVAERELRQKKGALSEVEAAEIERLAEAARQRRMAQGQAKTEAELVRQFMAQGSSRGKATFQARKVLEGRRALVDLGRAVVSILRLWRRVDLAVLMGDKSQVVENQGDKI